MFILDQTSKITQDPTAAVSPIAAPAAGFSAPQIARLLFDRAYSAWIIGKAIGRPCAWCDAPDGDGHCALEHYTTASLTTWILCGLTNGPLEGEVASEFLDAVTVVLRERVRLHTASLSLSRLGFAS